MPATVDLHLHTTASDGSFAPAQLVALLRQKGIRTFAVTDHDAVEGAVEMQAIVPPDLRFIPGVEFSCRSAVGKYHILGYGFDPRHPAILAAVEEGRQLRRQKQAQRIRWLEEQHGIRLTEEELRWLNSRKSPGKPHLGRILLDRGLDTEGAGMMGVLRRYVNGFKGGNDRIGVDTAVRAIRQAGGVAVWAHPLGGEGKRHKTHEELQPLLEDLLAHGVEGMECWYSRYSGQEIALLTALARQHGLLISGGSDFHGAPKPDLEPGTLSGDGIVPDPRRLTVLERC